MARPSAKHTSARLLLLMCVNLLGIAIADVLWASSPRFIHSSNDIADNWAPPVDISKPTIIAFPKKTSHETPHQGMHQQLNFGEVDHMQWVVAGRTGIHLEVGHWSLAVKDGKEQEKEWRSETPIPRGGPHRACVVVDGRLYHISGQEGDFMAQPGSPIFKCSLRNEEPLNYLQEASESHTQTRNENSINQRINLDLSSYIRSKMKWKVLPPLPKPGSHIEFACAVVHNSIVIVGGTTEKYPVTKRITLLVKYSSST